MMFRHRVAWVVLAASALLSAGCGGGGGAPSGASSTNPASAPASTNAASSAASGATVTITEKEFSITLATSSLKPGTYTFDVVNQGTMSHNLNIMGPGLSTTTSPTLSPGATGQITVTLRQGSYELWCSIDNHKTLGMDTTIQVA